MPLPASPRDPEQAAPVSGDHLGKVCPVCRGRYPDEFRVCPRDAAELEVAMRDDDPLIGATLGGTFHIVRAVGEGGMARVYEARHVRLHGKRFAVKVLHANYAQQVSVVARFQREAEAASGLAHPNVVDVFDVGRTADGTPYLVCEYLEGEDLASRLDEKHRIEVPAAIHIVRQVCRALATAHDRGVIHRDVKPDNVFLVGDPEAPIAKVIDFGISKVEAGGNATLTQTGMIMGTPGYMPPEQARGARTDHRADIYGVGAMLYRALTGRLPFDAVDPGEALSMVLTEEPPRPRSIEASIPEALELVIQRAMSKDPEDRYQSMAEFEEALAPFDPLTLSLSMTPSAPNAARAVNPRAVTVMSQSSVDLARATREAKLARPTLAVLSLIAYAWTVGCLVDGIGGALAVVRATALSRAEVLVIALTVGAASITPAVFWVRYVRSIWHNSVRAVERANSLRRLAIAAIFPYGLLALVSRMLGQGGDPEWSIALSAASLTIAAGAYAVERIRRRRRA